MFCACTLTEREKAPCIPEMMVNLSKLQKLDYYPVLNKQTQLGSGLGASLGPRLCSFASAFMISNV